jgi:asparagine synthase (glutamine-hydrolysing)
VLLSGAGGDDIFTGYRRHYALMQERWWSWLPGFARDALGAAARAIPVGNPSTRRLAKAFRYAGLDGDERIASYFFWLDPDELGPLYSPELRRELASENPAAPLLASLENLPDSTPALNRMLYLEGKHFLADHNLNYTDKMGMATGVEVRVPLLDPDLVAYAARLPLEYKQNGHVGKWIFKKAMEPWLPADVIYRPKTGFGAPIRHWLKDELAPLVEDVLSERALAERGLFDPRGVHDLVARDRAGRTDATYTIFALVCIELWCRMFVDGAPPSE